MEPALDPAADPLIADVIVVGAGPAGLAAALINGRARRRVLLLDDGTPVNANAPTMHGVVGFDGVPPSELRSRALAELAAYDVTHVQATVEALLEPDADGEPWTLQLADARTARAAAVVLATGVTMQLPPVEGLDALWGPRAATCPFCHAWEVRDRPLLAIGDAAALEHYVALLATWSDDVTPLEPAPGDRIEPADDGGVRYERADGAVHHAAFAFVAADPRPRSDRLLPDGIERDEQTGRPRLDGFGASSVPGLFIAGMTADPMVNVQMSLGSGARAAAGMNAWLLQDGRAALQRVRELRGAA